MEQPLSSPKQHKGVTKMLGYEYEIIYKKGKDNVIVDTLSHQYEDKGSSLALSAPIPYWLEESHQEWLQDPSTGQLINMIQMDPNPPHDYSWTESTLKYKAWLVLVPTSTLKNQILMELHSFSLAGHFGFQKTSAHA